VPVSVSVPLFDPEITEAIAIDPEDIVLGVTQLID
jgi:hypothetical protein